MKRHFLFLIMVFFFALAGETTAQVANPTPKPGASPENLTGVPAIAPDYRSDDRSLPELGRVGVDPSQQRPMTLKETIELALENNDDIEITRKNVRSAEFDVKSAFGIYQLRLTGQTYYERSKAANVSIFSSNPSTTQGSLVETATVTGYVPKFGTVLAGSFNNSAVTSNNSITILSPQDTSALGFSLTQPLFRGRRFDQTRRTIEIAKRNLALTDTQFRQRSIEVVTLAEKAYWDLAFALRNLQVQRDSVRDARGQLEHNRRLVAEGQLAPIDIVAAETQVANFEQAVYEALNTVNVAENALKNLIAPARSDAIWSQSLTPIDPVDLEAPRTTLTEAIDAALQNRPEIEINQAQKDINAIDQRLYHDQKKPQVDFTASYSSTGIGGSQNPAFSSPFPLPCTTAPTSPACIAQRANLALLTGNPLTGVFLNRYPTFRIGVNFNLPLFGDKTAEANLGKSLVEAEKIQTQREQLEQAIQVDVRNALQAIRTAEARLRAAAVARENTAKQYDSEQRKLDSGQSDVYKVLERQTALAAARGNELRARIEMNKAIADLQRATGNSLKAHGVVPKITK
jgi:outer membrane protein